MNKKRIAFLIVTLLFLRLNHPSTISCTQGNPISISYLGGILPKENINISLTNADVLFEINLNKYFILNLTFQSNYTIYNPEENTNITIAIPFVMRGGDIWDIKLSGNNTFIPFNWSYLIGLPESESWREYLLDMDLYGGFDLQAFIFNITIPANNSATIRCSFKYSENINFQIRNQGKYDLIYIVGTAKIWNGNITERVEYRALGTYPNKYTPQEDCCVSNFNRSKSFLWDWDNEPILYNFVGVSWHKYTEFNLTLDILTIWMIYAGIILIPITIATYQLIRIRKKHKK
ncbi:MAG: hypothetical protein ACFFDB_11700 [Promethearchaeota archaeon]